jgi:hypothetical protein
MNKFNPTSGAVSVHHTNAPLGAIRPIGAHMGTFPSVARATLEGSRAVISVLIDIGRLIDTGFRAWSAFTGHPMSWHALSGAIS